MKKIRERSYIRGDWDGTSFEDFSSLQEDGETMYSYGYVNSWFPFRTHWTRGWAFIKLNPKTTTIIIPSEFT